MYTQLIRFRLRWYALATGRVLMRHWQVLLIASLLVPMGTPVLVLMHFMALPVIGIFVPDRSLSWYLAHVILIQVVTLAWVMLQRSNISGNDFMRYAAALPISTALRRGVDLTMLLLANSILLVPFAIAAMFISSSMGRMDSIFQLMALGVLLSVVLVTQLAAFEKNTRALPGILLADLLLGLSLSLSPRLVAWVLLVLASFSIVSSLILRRPAKIPLFSIADLRITQPRSHRPLRNWIAHPLRIQFKALLINHQSSTVLRMGMALGIAVAADLLIRIFEFDARSLPTAIIAMAAMALILGSIYRTLQSVHLPMRHYLAALPLAPHYWAIHDSLFVMLLGMFPLGFLFLPLFIYGVSSLLTLTALAFAYQTLLVLLRLPLLLGGRQAALLGFLMASAWTGAAIAAIQ